jgi:hypothetical protein
MIIKTIALGGNKYPVELNMMGLEEFCEEEGIPLSGIGAYIGAGSVRKMYSLLHYMMRLGARIKGTEFTLSLDELGVLIGFDIEVVQKTLEATMPDLKGGPGKKPQRQARAKVKTLAKV